MKFLHNIFKSKKDNGICAECKAVCCHHIALEIDKPTSKASKIISAGIFYMKELKCLSTIQAHGFLNLQQNAQNSKIQCAESIQQDPTSAEIILRKSIM